MSLSRGTVPKPSTLGLIGQLTEGSQKSSLQNGLKRRTLRPRANRCLRQNEDFTLPSSWNDLRKEIQREELSSPKNAAILLRTVFTREKRHCMVADHA